MNAIQYEFAAEFTLFLVAIAGLALAGLRAGLLTKTRWAQALLVIGFGALAIAALLHGSAIVVATALWLAAIRLGGAASLAAGSLRWSDSNTSRQLVWAAAFLEAVDAGLEIAGSDAAAAATRATAAACLGTALIIASRRSIATRVAALGAATLLLLALVLSVGLSAVLASAVEDNEVENLDARARSEAADRIDSVQREVIKGARFTQDQLLSNRGTDFNALLFQLADAPRADPLLQTELSQISQNSLSGLGLAYMTRDKAVIAGAGVNPAAVAQIARSSVLQDALASEEVRASVDTVENEAIVIGVEPVRGRAPEGTMRLLGAVVAVSPLDDAYLEVRAVDDVQLSLALVTESGVAARHGAQPRDQTLRNIGDRVRNTGRGSVAVVDDRFVVAQPVRASNGQPVAAMVASVPTLRVQQAREDLYRTFFLIALGGTVLALVLAAVVGDRIGAGLRRLTSAAEAIQEGELGVRAEVASQDEVGVLGAAFNSMVASIEDKTDALRQAAEDEARLRNRLEAVVAGMGEALVAYDEAGRITDFNAAAEEILGRSRAEVQGKPITDIVRATSDEGVDLRSRLTPGSTGRWSAAGSVLSADGAPVPVAITAGSLAGDNGRSGGVLVLRDLRAEHEVERMKREFLSRVGHELRTPLAPIMGYAQILATRPVPPERARDLHQSIYGSAKRLQRIVEMLEFFSSLEAGQKVLRPEPLSVRELLGDALAKHEAGASSGGEAAAITRRVANGTPDVVADRHWLARAIEELIDNAVKFSPGGARVTVAARSVEVDGSSFVEISVADRGVGMSPDEVESAFAEFTQGDESDTRAFGGLGLGLALVRRVSERHGGEVACETSPGKGSKFTIVLPAVPKARRARATRA